MRIGAAKQSYVADAALFDTPTQRAWAAGLAIALVAFPFLANEYWLYLACLIAIHTASACGLNILTGYTGLVSLGQAAVMGLGAAAMSKSAMQFLLYGLASLMGISMSTIFVVYTGASIASTFFVTAAAFAGLSLYGYTTKRDLGPLGAFLFMALLGLIVALIVNLFLQSSGMAFLLNVGGVLIFAGLTAYDTQKIKQIYLDHSSSASAEDIGKAAVFGALSLYLYFINLFLHLLKLMGQKK